MYTKSILQQQLELSQAASRFENHISNIMENYTITNSVFCLSRSYQPIELENGYFVAESEHDTLEDAIKTMQPTQCLQVLENKTFVVGNYYQSLSTCPNDKKVLDLEFMQYIRE